jgi:hypothetical protein
VSREFFSFSSVNLLPFPRTVRIDIGHALFAAQEGKIDPAANPSKSSAVRA